MNSSAVPCINLYPRPHLFPSVNVYCIPTYHSTGPRMLPSSGGTLVLSYFFLRSVSGLITVDMKRGEVVTAVSATATRLPCRWPADGTATNAETDWRPAAAASAINNSLNIISIMSTSYPVHATLYERGCGSAPLILVLVVRHMAF